MYESLLRILTSNSQTEVAGEGKYQDLRKDSQEFAVSILNKTLKFLEQELKGEEKAEDIARNIETYRSTVDVIFDFVKDNDVLGKESNELCAILKDFCADHLTS